MRIEHGSVAYENSKKVSEFMQTKKAWIYFTIAISIISITQLILFGIGVIAINGIKNTDPESWKYWVTLSLTAIGSISGQLYHILIARRDRRFFITVLFGATINLIVSIIFNLYFSLIRILFGFSIQVAQFIRWKHPHKRVIKKMNMLILYSVIIFALGGAAGVGYLMNKTNIEYVHPAIPYIDFFTFIVAVSASFSVMLGYKEGQLLRLFSNISTSTTGILIGQWIVLLTSITSFTNVALSYIKWNFDFYHPKKEIK